MHKKKLSSGDQRRQKGWILQPGARDNTWQRMKEVWAQAQNLVWDVIRRQPQIVCLTSFFCRWLARETKQKAWTKIKKTKARDKSKKKTKKKSKKQKQKAKKKAKTKNKNKAKTKSKNKKQKSKQTKNKINNGQQPRAPQGTCTPERTCKRKYFDCVELSFWQTKTGGFLPIIFKIFKFCFKNTPG